MPILIGLLAAAVVLAILFWPKRSPKVVTLDPRLTLQDSTPLGAPFARRIWREVIRLPDGEGIMPNRHRDYCGHGLVRLPEGIALMEIYDGMPTKTPFAVWREEPGFTAFFARQSNNSLNGYDPAEPTFYTEDEWALGNQRLTRDSIERCLRDLERLPSRPRG